MEQLKLQLFGLSGVHKSTNPPNLQIYKFTNPQIHKSTGTTSDHGTE